MWLGHDGQHLASVIMLIHLSVEAAACAVVFQFYFLCSFNHYRPNDTSVPANVLIFGQAVQHLYRCVIPLFKAPSNHEFKTVVFFECLEFFYWLLRLSETDF
jgi:hypothetical protein